MKQPKEIEEAMLCQKMFSPLDEKTAYHYKLDLYSKDFDYELKGLLQSDSSFKGQILPNSLHKTSDLRGDNHLGDQLPLPKQEVSLIRWKCLRCNIHYTIETVQPFKADKCPVCGKMDRITLVDYKVK